MNRNDIKTIIKERFYEKDVQENEIELFTKYHLSEKIGENEKIQLIDIYNRLMNINKQSLSKKIDTKKVKTLIMFLSISPIKNDNQLEDLLDENILNKNLRIFENIEEFIIIYSSGSEKFLDLLQKEYVGIKFTLVFADFSFGYNDIERKITYLLKDKTITRENTIIDLTLGMKYVSIFFYKLAIENDLYAINWYMEQLPVYKKIENSDKYEILDKKFFKRLPFTAKLKVMIEPRKENAKIYSKINSGIRSFNFSLVENLYEKVGNRNMSVFFKELAKLYSFENMISLDSDNFYESLEEFFKEITDKTTKDIIIQGNIKTFLEHMFALIYYEETPEEIEEDDEVIREYESRNFSWKTKFLKLFSIDEKTVDDKASYLFFKRNRIYFYFVLAYFQNYKNKKLYSYDRFLLKIVENILKELREKDITISKEKILNNPRLLLNKDYSKDIENMDTRNILTESIKGDFYFKNNILFIEKFGLSINVKEYQELSFINGKGFKLLLELLENPEESIEGKVLYGKLNNLSGKADELEDEENEKKKKRFRKVISDLKKKRIKDFNENIKEIAKDQGIVIPDIIICDKYKNSKLESDHQHYIKINPEIYNLI